MINCNNKQLNVESLMVKQKMIMSNDKCLMFYVKYSMQNFVCPIANARCLLLYVLCSMFMLHIQRSMLNESMIDILKGFANSWQTFTQYLEKANL